MNSPLATIPLGRTDLAVTRLGLGTAPIGNLYAPVTDEQAVAVVHAALESGVRFFDTAPLYGDGASERRLGLALRGVPRAGVVISTKVGRSGIPNQWSRYDFSRDAVLRSFEASLTRLGTDYVDILHIHDPDDHERQALEEAFPTLAELRAQGAIRAIGAGMNQWQMLARFARAADFDCFLLAGRYTLLEQGALEFLALCRERGIGVLLGGVFNSGILATGPRAGAKYNYADAPPDVLERAGTIAAACERHGAPLATAAVQFVLAHPAVTTAVIGAVSPEEVRANVRAASAPVPAALWDELRAAGLIPPDAPTPASGTLSR
ncbi:MAG TPA: aldo/keto reductase [Roseiflexaceae bacterium]|nr:aldo/keto reductase [Roseiflexaceae bacterium]